MIEQKNKTTLIIDGNWLLMSRLGIMMKNFVNTLPPEHLEQAKREIIDFVAQSINKTINFWGNYIDNIIMVQDGGSWRKQVAKPKLYEGDYKGNRIPDNNIAWNYVWDALRTICEFLKENNISCIHESNIEGDDWCWYWSRYLNHEGINCIIWSSDADLKQLVQHKNGAWTIWYNDKAGLVLPESLHYSDMDILMNFEAVDPFIDEITKKTNSITYINPDDIVMMKVICGDAGDNIKSIMRYEKTTKTGKKQIVQVSKKEWEKVKTRLDIHNIKDFIQKKINIIKYLKCTKRFKNYKESVEDIAEMFDFNLILVRLHRDSIPQASIDLMNLHKDEYKIADINFIRNNYKVLAQHEESVEKLFEDLPF